MNKKVYISIMGIMFFGLLLFSAPKTQAFGYSSDIVKMLSEKLGVDENKVQQAIESIKNERRQEITKQFDDKLSQMVKDGKLTKDQKTLILAKHKEIEKKRQSNISELKRMTPEQRKERLQREREEIITWAKDNNIDLTQIFGLRHFNGMHRERMMLDK